MIADVILLSLLISMVITLVIGSIGIWYIRSLCKKFNVRYKDIRKSHARTQNKIDDLCDQVNNIRSDLANELVNKTMHIKNIATGGSVNNDRQG